MGVTAWMVMNQIIANDDRAAERQSEDSMETPTTVPAAVNMFNELVGHIEAVAANVEATIKADLASIADEAALGARLVVEAEAEVAKLVSLPVVEGFINSRLPGVLKLATPVAVAIEGAVIPKVEADAIAWLVAKALALIDARLGADWFVKAKAAI